MQCQTKNKSYFPYILPILTCLPLFAFACPITIPSPTELNNDDHIFYAKVTGYTMLDQEVCRQSTFIDISKPLPCEKPHGLELEVLDSVSMPSGNFKHVHLYRVAIGLSCWGGSKGEWTKTIPIGTRLKIIAKPIALPNIRDVADDTIVLNIDKRDLIILSDKDDNLKKVINYFERPYNSSTQHFFSRRKRHFELVKDFVTLEKTSNEETKINILARLAGVIPFDFYKTLVDKHIHKSEIASALFTSFQISQFYQKNHYFERGSSEWKKHKDFLHRFANSGFSEFQLYLAEHLLKGDVDDFKEALRAFEQSAERGISYSEYRIGLIYQELSNTGTDSRKKALRRLSNSALARAALIAADKIDEEDFWSAVVLANIYGKQSIFNGILSDPKLHQQYSCMAVNHPESYKLSILDLNLDCQQANEQADRESREESLFYRRLDNYFPSLQ